MNWGTLQRILIIEFRLKRKEEMKNIKEMIIPILVGFTLVVSVYSSVKVIQNEKKINQNWDYIQEIGEKLNKEIE